MTRDEMFPSKFFKASEMKGPVTVTIAGEQQEILGDDKTEKTVLFFRDSQKKLVLNGTNFDLIHEVLGLPDSREWVGHKITLYPTKTTFGSKRVDCVRVATQEWFEAQAAKRQQHAPPTQPADPHEPPPWEPDILSAG
jgi:hypothetical protein